MSPTKKTTLNARVKLVAGPALGLYGRIAAFDESAWTADVALDDGRTARGVPMKHLEMIEEEAISDREKLLDRIRKMHLKAESAAAIGSNAEAQSFAAAVQKMLAKYKLSMSDIEFTTFEKEEPIGEGDIEGTGTKAKRQAWVDDLAGIVARAHQCRILVNGRSDWLGLVGRPTDRAIAAFVFTTLRRNAEEQSDKEARAFRKMQRRTFGHTPREAQDFRAAWLDGYVTKIAQRYREEDRQRYEQAKAAGTSLVRLEHGLAQVDDHIKSNYRPGGRLKNQIDRISANTAGRRAGEAAGAKAGIRGTGIGASTSAPRKALR